jgi:hypothetical protein
MTGLVVLRYACLVGHSHWRHEVLAVPERPDRLRRGLGPGERACVSCATALAPGTPRQTRYCPLCRVERNRELMRAAKRKYRERHRQGKSDVAGIIAGGGG